MEYLYYLPFCMVFVSNDNLHLKTVPLFMQSHQSFVWGEDLKTDLRRLDGYFDKLSDEEKAKGISSFASNPPKDSSFLVTKLWDKHMSPKWRISSEESNVIRNPENDRNLIAELTRLAEAPETKHSGSESSPEGLKYVITKHYVRKKKGKWNRFPPDVDKK